MENNEVTLDDLKQKVGQINLALAQQMRSQRIKIYIATATVITAAICVSYLLGKKRGRR